MRIALTLDRDTDLSETNDYLRALTAAGVPREAIDVVTPLSPASRPFDALVLGGGADVDPARYGEPVLEDGRVEVDAERDAIDFRLLEEARRSGAPVLGICRGLQVVNVALGGTLVQDIPTERPSPVVHERSKAEKTRRDHQVSIAPGTRLAAIAGVPEAAVNSRHHQAIGRGVGARARRPAGGGRGDRRALAGRRPVAPREPGRGPRVRPPLHGVPARGPRPRCEALREISRPPALLRGVPYLVSRR
jgi:putative glutamine amidotransferase